MLDSVADEQLIAEALVSEMEANEVAKAEALANMIAFRVTEGHLGVLEVLGQIERR